MVEKGKRLGKDSRLAQACGQLACPFPNAPERLSYPEARGLRHLAFQVDNIDDAIASLNSNGIECEPIRVDEFTGKRFTFFEDPDNLPLELCEK